MSEPRSPSVLSRVYSLEQKEQGGNGSQRSWNTTQHHSSAQQWSPQQQVVVQKSRSPQHATTTFEQQRQHHDEDADTIMNVEDSIRHFQTQQTPQRSMNMSQNYQHSPRQVQTKMVQASPSNAAERHSPGRVSSGHLSLVHAREEDPPQSFAVHLVNSPSREERHEIDNTAADQSVWDRVKMFEKNQQKNEKKSLSSPVALLHSPERKRDPNIQGEPMMEQHLTMSSSSIIGQYYSAEGSNSMTSNRYSFSPSSRSEFSPTGSSVGQRNNSDNRISTVGYHLSSPSRSDIAHQSHEPFQYYEVGSYETDTRPALHSENSYYTSASVGTERANPEEAITTEETNWPEGVIVDDSKTMGSNWRDDDGNDYASSGDPAGQVFAFSSCSTDDNDSDDVFFDTAAEQQEILFGEENNNDVYSPTGSQNMSSHTEVVPPSGKEFIGPDVQEEVTNDDGTDDDSSASDSSSSESSEEEEEDDDEEVSIDGDNLMTKDEKITVSPRDGRVTHYDNSTIVSRGTNSYEKETLSSYLPLSSPKEKGAQPAFEDSNIKNEKQVESEENMVTGKNYLTRLSPKHDNHERSVIHATRTIQNHSFDTSPKRIGSSMERNINVKVDFDGDDIAPSARKSVSGLSSDYERSDLDVTRPIQNRTIDESPKRIDSSRARNISINVDIEEDDIASTLRIKSLTTSAIGQLQNKSIIEQRLPFRGHASPTTSTNTTYGFRGARSNISGLSSSSTRDWRLKGEYLHDDNDNDDLEESTTSGGVGAGDSDGPSSPSRRARQRRTERLKHTRGASASPSCRYRTSSSASINSTQQLLHESKSNDDSEFTSQRKKEHHPSAKSKEKDMIRMQKAVDNLEVVEDLGSSSNSISNAELPRILAEPGRLTYGVRPLSPPSTTTKIDENKSSEQSKMYLNSASLRRDRLIRHRRVGSSASTSSTRTKEGEQIKNSGEEQHHDADGKENETMNNSSTTAIVDVPVVKQEESSEEDTKKDTATNDVMNIQEENKIVQYNNNSTSKRNTPPRSPVAGSNRIYVSATKAKQQDATSTTSTDPFTHHGNDITKMSTYDTFLQQEHDRISKSKTRIASPSFSQAQADSQILISPKGGDINLNRNNSSSIVNMKHQNNVATNEKMEEGKILAEAKSSSSTPLTNNDEKPSTATATQVMNDIQNFEKETKDKLSIRNDDDSVRLFSLLSSNPINVQISKDTELKNEVNKTIIPNEPVKELKTSEKAMSKNANSTKEEDQINPEKSTQLPKLQGPSSIVALTITLEGAQNKTQKQNVNHQQQSSSNQLQSLHTSNEGSTRDMKSSGTKAEGESEFLFSNHFGTNNSTKTPSSSGYKEEENQSDFVKLTSDDLAAWWQNSYAVPAEVNPEETATAAPTTTNVIMSPTTTTFASTKHSATTGNNTNSLKNNMSVPLNLLVPTRQQNAVSNDEGSDGFWSINNDNDDISPLGGESPRNRMMFFGNDNAKKVGSTKSSKFPNNSTSTGNTPRSLLLSSPKRLEQNSEQERNNRFHSGFIQNQQTSTKSKQQQEAEQEQGALSDKFAGTHQRQSSITKHHVQKEELNETKDTFKDVSVPVTTTNMRKTQNKTEEALVSDSSNVAEETEDELDTTLDSTMRATSDDDEEEDEEVTTSQSEVDKYSNNHQRGGRKKKTLTQYSQEILLQNSEEKFGSAKKGNTKASKKTQSQPNFHSTDESTNANKSGWEMSTSRSEEEESSYNPNDETSQVEEEDKDDEVNESEINNDSTVETTVDEEQKQQAAVEEGPIDFLLSNFSCSFLEPFVNSLCEGTTEEKEEGENKNKRQNDDNNTNMVDDLLSSNEFTSSMDGDTTTTTTKRVVESTFSESDDFVESATVSSSSFSKNLRSKTNFRKLQLQDDDREEEDVTTEQESEDGDNDDDDENDESNDLSTSRQQAEQNSYEDDDDDDADSVNDNGATAKQYHKEEDNEGDDNEEEEGTKCTEEVRGFGIDRFTSKKAVMNQEMEMESKVSRQEPLVLPTTPIMKKRIMQQSDAAKLRQNQDYVLPTAIRNVDTTRDDTIKKQVVKQQQQQQNRILLSPTSSVASTLSRKLHINGQQPLIDRFCSRLRNDGVEVLKLNRDGKWHTKILTVSSEVTHLGQQKQAESPSSGTSDSVESKVAYPKGLLWVKKLHTSKGTKEHSASSISRHGKGGVFFDSLVGVEEVDSSSFSSLSKKQSQGKFQDSVVVQLTTKATTTGLSSSTSKDSNTKQIQLRCINKQDALMLCSGCTLLARALRTLNTRRSSNATTPRRKNGGSTSSNKRVITTAVAESEIHTISASKVKGDDGVLSDRWEC